VQVRILLECGWDSRFGILDLLQTILPKEMAGAQNNSKAETCFRTPKSTYTLKSA